MSNAKEYYNKHSKEYVEKWSSIDKDLNNPSNYFRKKLINTVIRMAEVKSADKVIEIGCGTGLVLKELLKTTKPVFGTDISIEMLKRVYTVLGDRKVFLVDRFAPDESDEADVYVMVNDFLNLTLPVDYFDKFLSVEVLRYTPNLEACLKNIKKIMKPNSLFVFTITNFLSFSLFPIRFYLRKRLGLVKDSELMQYFVTERSIKKKIREAGFSIVNFKRFRMLSINPVISRLLLRTSRAAQKIDNIDRKLENIPILRNFFDTFIIAIKKPNSQPTF